MKGAGIRNFFGTVNLAHAPLLCLQTSTSSFPSSVVVSSKKISVTATERGMKGGEISTTGSPHKQLRTSSLQEFGSGLRELERV